VFQQFNLIPSLSVLDNVALPLLYQGLAPAARAAQSLAVLETLGIADKAGQRPDDLSGGQKQRVAIARALVAQPALMIADEPTGSLDPRHADEVMTLLCELNQAGMALVMVTHDLALAARAKSRWRIAAGRIVHD
jgi:putative ABC transport system ATP-binding protein